MRGASSDSDHQMTDILGSIDVESTSQSIVRNAGRRSTHGYEELWRILAWVGGGGVYQRKPPNDDGDHGPWTGHG